MADAAAFIGSYRAAWEDVIAGRADVSALTRFFHLPCMVVEIDGSVTLQQSQEDLLAFNAARLASFREGGAAAARIRSMDVLTQGPRAAMAVVNWEILRADGSLERAWRHYYMLALGGETPKILVSNFQIGA